MNIVASFGKFVAGHGRSWIEQKSVLFPMNIVVSFGKSLASRGPKRRSWIDVSIFLLWFVMVCFLALHHVMWRDEVRALSITLDGNNIIEMLKKLHGEGHP